MGPRASRKRHGAEASEPEEDSIDCWATFLLRKSDDNAEHLDLVCEDRTD